MILNDSQIYYNPFDSNCSECKHFNIDNFSCIAFPNGIPIQILSGENKHLKPLPEQKNNIVFTPINE